MHSASHASAFQNHAVELIAWQDHYTAASHQGPPEVPPDLAGLERAVVEQHLTNFELWHAEDSARTPGASDRDLARIKRFIDSTNQRRNDLAEQCDLLLLGLLAPQNLPSPAAELHSESPGLMIDRLSILSLGRSTTPARKLTGPALPRDTRKGTKNASSFSGNSAAIWRLRWTGSGSRCWRENEVSSCTASLRCTMTRQ